MSQHSDSPSSDPDRLELLSNRHAKFFRRILQVVSSSFSAYDTSRITIAFFSLAGLDLLNSLHILDEEKAKIIDWIYSLQVEVKSADDDRFVQSGFRGSTTLKCSSSDYPTHEQDCGHLAMTYTALTSLLILGDDFGRLNRQAILAGVKALQQENGSFASTLRSGENDMRFLYCASTICHILNDWSCMDVDQACEYIMNSLSYEGAFGQGPNLEAHGGPTYCAVASLHLMGRLDLLSGEQRGKLIRWCVFRLTEGYQGRPNKPDDTCYSFWIGATIKILCPDNDELLRHKCDAFVLSTQDPIVGGMAKWPDNVPDPLHTYFGLGGLSLSGEKSLAQIDPALNISKRALAHLLAMNNR